MLKASTVVYRRAKIGTPNVRSSGSCLGLSLRLDSGDGQRLEVVPLRARLAGEVVLVIELCIRRENVRVGVERREDL